MDRNYPRFYRNFLIESDNGRPSLRLANTFSIEITSIKLESIDNNIRLHLKPKSCVRLIHSLLFIVSLMIDSLIKQQSGF
jgi:hypothetical protein